jgi:hypothetical protein
MSINDQPPPVPNEKPDVWSLVIDDMRERDHVGRQRYGTPLQPNNGRDALVDAYQEALDLAVYLRQEIEERRIAETAAFEAGRLSEREDLLAFLERELASGASWEIVREVIEESEIHVSEENRCAFPGSGEHAAWCRCGVEP